MNMNRSIAPAAPIQLGDAETLFAGEDEYIVAGAAPAIEPQPDDAVLFWANQRPVVIPKGRGSANVSQKYNGFLIPTDQHPLLDEAMDLAGFEAITIQHTDVAREHWCLPEAALFVIATGVQSRSQMKATAERHGIAYGEHAMRDLKTGQVVISDKTGKAKPESVLRFRCFLPQLVAVGYFEPLRFSISGTMTGDMLRGFTAQFAVFRAVRDLRERAGMAPIQLPFWSYAQTWMPGPEVSRGIAKVIPPSVRMPQAIDLDYLRSHRVNIEIAELVKDRLAETILWSIEESARINADSNPAQGGAPVGQDAGEDASWPTDKDAPPLDSEGKRYPF